MKSASLLTSFIILSLSCGQDGNLAPNPNPDSADELASGLFQSGLSSEQVAQVRRLRMDVNDVSFLWPITTSTTENELIPLIDNSAPERNLVPSAAPFHQVSRFFDVDLDVVNPVTGLPEGVDGFTDTLVHPELPDLLRVVSFRYDDCAIAPEVSDNQTIALVIGFDPMGNKQAPSPKIFDCVPQLRVVAQLDSLTDAGVHLIYTFVDEPASFVADLARGVANPADTSIQNALLFDLQFLKSVSPVATDGLPLGVHPGMQESGFGGAFTEQVGAFLRFYARPEYLTHVTYLSTNDFDGGADWAMVGSVINHQNPDELVLTPQLERIGSPLSIHFRLGSNDSLMLEFDTPAIRDELEDTDAQDFVQVSNPNLTSVTNVDCVSCHRETQAYVRMAENQNPMLEEILRDPEFFAPAAGITAFVDPMAVANDEIEFHNFGHMSARPQVAVRTAHESAAVAAAVNQRIHGSSEGPGISCSPEERVELWQRVFGNARTSDWKSVRDGACSDLGQPF